MKEKWEEVEGPLSVVELWLETTTKEAKDVKMLLAFDLKEAWEKVRSLEESLTMKWEERKRDLVDHHQDKKKTEAALLTTEDRIRHAKV